MTYVEEYGDQGLLLIYDYLEESRERMGDFQISRRSLRKVLIRNFDITYQGGRDVVSYVIDRLLEKGELHPVQKKIRSGTIFQVVSGSQAN